jgi:hypothetical protein
MEGYITAMNIEHKKTALDDSASIYSRNRAAANKETLKNMTPKEKFKFFIDYYSKASIVIVIILIGVISLLNQTVFNRSTCVLSVSCINDIQIGDSDLATEELEEYLAIENKNDYASVSYYSTDDPNMNMAYVAHIATGSLDIVLCSEAYFLAGCEQGMFADLSTFLTAEQYDLLADRMIEGQNAKTDDMGNVVSHMEPMPFGINISDSVKFQEYTGYGIDPILCVASTTKNAENVIKGITWFTGVELPVAEPAAE